MFGAAIDGFDYQASSFGIPIPPFTGAIVIPPGLSVITLDVTPIDDLEIEGAENIRVEIFSTFEYSTGKDDSAKVIIADNDKAPEGSIGDTVFNDLNDNGVRDKKETGIGGVSVSLFLDANGNQELDVADVLLDVQITGDDGHYDFPFLVGDNYIVEVADDTGPLAGSVHTTDNNPLAVALQADEDFNDGDFGSFNPADLQFGAAASNANAKLEFRGVTDSLGDDGYGMITLDKMGYVSIDYFNTTAKSKAKVTAPKGEITEILDVHVTGVLGGFDARVANFLGDYTSTGSTGKFVVHDLDANHLITIGPGDEKAAFSLQANNVIDTTLNSAIPIKKIDVTTWENTDGVPDTTTALGQGRPE